jgi:hypothetical protein
MENKKNEVPLEVYKKLLCDMIQDMEDSRFIRQIYSIVLRQKQLNEKKAGN